MRLFILLILLAILFVSGCIQPQFSKKVNIETDEMEYNQGEMVSVEAENQTQLYYLSCSGGAGFKVFRVGTFSQEELDFNPYFGEGKYSEHICVDGKTVYEFRGWCDVVYCQPMYTNICDVIDCQRIRQTNYQDRFDDLKFTWDQTEFITVNDTCGNQTYETKKKRQVTPGKYKVVFAYYIDPKCTKLESVENEFIIK